MGLLALKRAIILQFFVTWRFSLLSRSFPYGLREWMVVYHDKAILLVHSVEMETSLSGKRVHALNFCKENIKCLWDGYGSPSWSYSLPLPTYQAHLPQTIRKWYRAASTGSIIFNTGAIRTQDHLPLAYSTHRPAHHTHDFSIIPC